MTRVSHTLPLFLPFVLLGCRVPHPRKPEMQTEAAAQAIAPAESLDAPSRPARDAEPNASAGEDAADRFVPARTARAIRLKQQGCLLLKNRHYDSAVDRLTQVIALSPRDAVAYEYRGLAYYRSGRYGPAIADYTTAIRLRPERPMLYFYRALARRDGGDEEGARSDFTVAIGLKPDGPLARNAQDMLDRLDARRETRE